ncbi:MAG TPA: hypothetical protein PLF81_16825 [Candidatus Anammoximicrobium sp.]|nr:hypothetical protein [Candidatus Anammoximicrobium sp.]
MPISVIEAVKMGIWDFEPDEQEASDFEATRAMPGTDEKLVVMAERVRQGLPLWHPEDRRTYDATGETD